jgi:integrase
MPKRFSLTPVHIPGRSNPWKIDIPASVSPSGRRARYFFDTKQAALNFSEDQKMRLKNYGIAGQGTLSPSKLEQAGMAFEAIERYDVSLNEIVRDWIARREAAEASVTFRAGFAQFKEYLAHRKIKGRPVSRSYLKQIRNTFPRFPSLHDKRLTEINSTMIAAATKGMAPAAKNALLRALSAFFVWASEIPRQWCKANPVAGVPRESTGGGEIHTFTPDQVSRIMTACVEYDDSLLPYHSLGFFAGIRPEELERARWEFVNLEEGVVVLPADATKTRTRRVIEITDTLTEWLNWIVERHGIQHGPVVSRVALVKRLRALRRPTGVPWIQDGMRHTYASNWLAIHKDEHRLRDNLGHKSADELWEHYHKAVTKREAEKFWKVLPPEETKVVAFPRRGA